MLALHYGRRVARSKQINVYVESKLKEMENDDDFSDLDPLLDMDKKHALVKCVLFNQAFIVQPFAVSDQLQDHCF